MNYKYDAFISYRHCDLDKYVAENLHRILESYDLPKKIKEKLNITGKPFKRVFRDQEELPLSSNLEDPIIDALKNSKYLIVICSPRLKDSLWCKKEIETFKKLRGRKNIFCVLVEGEPKDSFPEEVLYDEVETETKSGKKKKEKILVEPLAADVRGNTKKEVLKRIKEEKLRLVAPMYNLDYDDLKQRHKLRKQRKIIITSLIVAAFCFLFAIYTSIMLIKINSQKNMLKIHQAESLSKKSEEYLKNDNRYDAVKSAYQALTEFNNVKMPYTPEAEYELVESLGLYDAGASYKSISELKTDGIANSIKSSDDNKYALVYDESEKLTLFDTETLKKIKTINLEDSYIDEHTFTFVGNDMFSYIDNNGNVIIESIKENKIIKEIKHEKEKFKAIKGNLDGKYLTYINNKTMYVYDVKENKVIITLTDKNSYMNNIYYSEDDKYLLISTTDDNYDYEKEDYIKVHVIDLENKTEINSVEINASFIAGMITKGDNLYMLLNRSFGSDFNMKAVSYNFKSNKINWSRSFDKNFGRFITRSYQEGTNNIVVVNYQGINVLDGDTGEIKNTFSADSEIINIYSYVDKEIYLLFLSDGSVNYLNMEYESLIEYSGKYEFNLDEYSKVSLSQKGFLLIPYNDNRVILYETKSNKDIKKEDIKLDYVDDESIPLSQHEKIIEEYNIKNKSLVKSIFYSTNKEELFVNYSNEDLVIYNVKDKKIINSIEKLGSVNHYFGKDKYNRIYIGTISNSYILDENYNKVGHIKGLAKLEKEKVIILNNDNYYSIKIYNLKEILNEAKEYLK